MSAFTNIENAFRATLAGMADIPPVAWPNVRYTPEVGVEYIKFDIFFAEPTQNTLGTYGTNDIRGFVQISCNYPTDEGNGAIRALVSRLTDTFKRGTDLTYSGTRVTVLNSYPSASIIESPWYTVPVTINFRAITEN